MTTHIVSLWLLKHALTVHRTHPRGQGVQSDNAVDLMLDQHRQAHHMVRSESERLSCVGLPEVYLSSYEAIGKPYGYWEKCGFGEDTDVPPIMGLYPQGSTTTRQAFSASFLFISNFE